MQHARIAELLEPFLNPCHSEPARSGAEEPAVLSPAQLDHISMYIDILLRWNLRINLTAIRNEEEIVTRHFGESLFAAQHLFPHERHQGREGHGFSHAATTRKEDGALAPVVADARLADVGSGAGFPGIPIKLWAPKVHVTLIESNHKKATFLREVVRALRLTEIDIQNVRADSLAERSFDVVTLRAVERFESILPIAAGLVRPTGRLVLLIGSCQLAQARSALPTMSWPEPRSIPHSQSRVVAMGSFSNE
jgi:16S rRNA (guanine527-N7)-methyltransferase